MAHILIVEDNSLVGTLLCEAIVLAGHSADCVTTKSDAERLLGTRAHALAVVDIHLPDGSGLDFAVRAESLGIESILTTADHEKAAEMAEAGIGVLVKPFGMAEFERLIAAKLLSKDQAACPNPAQGTRYPEHRCDRDQAAERKYAITPH